MQEDFDDLFGEPEDSPHQITDSLEKNTHSSTPTIRLRENAVIADFSDLDFTQQPATTPLVVIMEKQPLRLQTGRTYYGQIVIDTNYQVLGPLVATCKQLKALPPKVRAKAVLKLLREKLKYAFPTDIQKLKLTDPNKASWIETHTGLGNKAERVLLSEIFQHEYAICYHLAYAYLWLCQQAGLEGTTIPVRDNDIVNILRTDTKQPLFKSAPIGSPTAGHVYTELLMPDGEWLAVDPSTDLISDTPEGQEMFRAARYQAFVTHELSTHTSSKDIGIHKTHALIPAMKRTTAQAFQLHSPKETRALFRAGLSPTTTTTNRSPACSKLRFTITTPRLPDIVQLKIRQAQAD